MVVNRKQPAAPQPVSRSASTQHVPTKRHVPTKGVSKPTNLTGTGSQATNSAAKKVAKVQVKKGRSRSLLDRLFLLSLSVFACYAFYTCRPNPIFTTPLHNNAIDPNPLCRSLHGYRVHILEPYVLPSVKHTLSFTQDIAEPYIAATRRKVDPYVAPVVKVTQTVKPYVMHAVNTSKAIWSDTLVPFYKGTLLRYYRIAILPRYRLYIKPRLLPLTARASKVYVHYVSRPLHIQATRLNKALRSYIHPYVGQIQPYVNQAYTIGYKVMTNTITVYSTHVHPRVVAAWRAARPHLCTALKFSKAASVKTAEIVTAKAKFAAREASVYRRAYVDPHVRKIWDKVAEGTPSASVLATTPPLDADLPDTTPEIFEAETAEYILEATASTASDELEPAPVEATVEASIEDTYLANPAIPTPEETADSSVLATSQTPYPPVENAKESGAETPTSAYVSLTPIPVIADAIKVVPTEEPSSLATPVSDELDIDAFLADLGVQEEPEIEVPVESPPAPVIAEKTAEEVEEERLAAIAAKREALVTRHEKWFSDLSELIANETVELVDALTDWRSAKVSELATISAGNGTGLGFIDEVQATGERLIKGLEGYVRKAETRSASWKLPSGNPADVSKDKRHVSNALSKAEKEKWGKVVEKVEEKFAEAVQSLRAKVHTWFVEERAHEAQIVTSSTLRVKDMAERAQADLGLPYAWLEDVTYEDWQGYHELMNMYQQYDETARSLQNGTEMPEPAPLPPTDPIVPALDALDKDLQDVITGFSVALGPVRSAATRVFSVLSNPEEADAEDSGFFVVRDGEVRRDDMRDVDVGTLGISKKEGAGTIAPKETVDKETLKILPIGAGPGEEGEALNPGMIFVGKDKVRIEEALGSIPVEPSAARHEEL